MNTRQLAAYLTTALASVLMPAKDDKERAARIAYAQTALAKAKDLGYQPDPPK